MWTSDEAQGYPLLMALRSTTKTAGSVASILVVGEPGDAGTPKTVRIVPAADVLIGGIDAQTFTVTSAGIQIDLVAGDTVYVKRAAGSDVAVQVLEVGV